MPITVRVVEYTLSHPTRGHDEPPIRLITTLLDPEQAPASELAALYAQRWEEENAFDELKTHQRGAGRVLRSKSPDMVIQEIYAHLLVFYAIRALINQVAEPANLDPDRVSFIRSLRVIRRQVAVCCSQLAHGLGDGLAGDDLAVAAKVRQDPR